MATGRGHPYGCSQPLTMYIDIHTDIRADVRVELSVLRTVRPGMVACFLPHCQPLRSAVDKSDAAYLTTAVTVTLLVAARRQARGVRHAARSAA